jgi:D-ribose pyranose/furanose isomerase RbsD
MLPCSEPPGAVAAVVERKLREEQLVLQEALEHQERPYKEVVALLDQLREQEEVEATSEEVVDPSQDQDQVVGAVGICTPV